jgi:Cu(I)/Ag(I) efflux system membrane fusion protein
VTLSASPTPVAGKVVRIRPEVDPATRTVQIEIDVPNAELRLAPGAFATVEFDIGTDRGVPLLSESAVRTFAGVRKVFVVTGGKAAERIVTLGRRSGDRVEVTSGLKAGEAYVAAPPAGLYAGVPVTVEGGGAPAAPEKGK